MTKKAETITYEVVDLRGNIYLSTDSLEKAISECKRVLFRDRTRVFMLIKWVEGGDADWHQLDCTIDQWGKFAMYEDM